MLKRVFATALVMSSFVLNSFAENCKVSSMQLGHINHRIQSSLNRMQTENPGNLSVEFIQNTDLQSESICSLENSASYPIVDGLTHMNHQASDKLAEGTKISLGDGVSDEFFIVGANKEHTDMLKASDSKLSLLISLNNTARVESGEGTYITLLNYRDVHVLNRATGDVMPLHQLNQNLGRLGLVRENL